jgi:hypothetical protein
MVDIKKSLKEAGRLFETIILTGGLAIFIAIFLIPVALIELLVRLKNRKTNS